MNLKTWASTLILAGLVTGTVAWAAEGTASETVAASQILPASEVAEYPDHRPSARHRLEARDQGVVFRHGTGPGRCDHLGARDAWVFESDGTYYMHYDGAGPRGWLCCLATSKDLLNWTAKGPVLDFGAKDEEDSASAAYGVTYFDGSLWPNRLVGDATLPAEQRRTVTNVRTYDTVAIGAHGCRKCEDRKQSGQPAALLPSGLLRPVRLIAEE
jgi:hypothetical protein